MKQSITVVNGIGESTRGILAEHGITTIADLAKVSVAKLAAVPGFGEVRAGNAIAAAVALMETVEGGAIERAEAAPVKKSKDKKKAKKKKKDKPKGASKDEKAKDKKSKKKKKNKKKKKKK